MRVLHTADWHLGRTLEGRSRLQEQAQFLDELVDIVRDQQIDVVLMAGDVFDTFNPPAAAEEMFYETMARIADYGKRSVAVISGNHDSPDRIQAASSLANKHGITLIGRPELAVHTIHVPRTTEVMKLAALPYPSESRLKEVLSESNDELMLRNKYDEKIQAIFSTMSESFATDTVNIAMSHIFVAGGSSTDSERPIEVGGAYTVLATSLPEQAQYVALGHLHRPQNIKRARTAARYSGSPLAYSFSEANYAKSVTVLDVAPGETVKPDEVYLSSGKPLVTWKAKEGLLEVYRWLDEGRDKHAWIDLEIHLQDALTTEEIQKLRKLHPGFINIRPVFKQEFEEAVHTSRSNMPIDELFTRFYSKQSGGATPDRELVELFLKLVTEDEKEDEVERS
ncbi:exonuclease SbcCD subunit D [Bacillus sp. HMF5848]|uniref:exonuclease SbcCD subunit D n=1 Tax=Bacillus sp. HMF5848 TaxID=2495421 RepID=UPI000F779CA2|nr:exonuclease SbcCD subunit D [Bacillus sp. HMF5848]RSK26357.1 exonuclease SbcCD subunit D [Bacillus sp. HMF5848]